MARKSPNTRRRNDTKNIHIQDDLWQWKIIDIGYKIRIYFPEWDLDDKWVDVDSLDVMFEYSHQDRERALEKKFWSITPRYVKTYILEQYYDEDAVRIGL